MRGSFQEGWRSFQEGCREGSRKVPGRFLSQSVSFSPDGVGGRVVFGSADFLMMTRSKHNTYTCAMLLFVFVYRARCASDVRRFSEPHTCVCMCDNSSFVLKGFWQSADERKERHE